MTDPTTVRVTIRKIDAHQFLFRIGTAPHEVTERPGGLADLEFREWDHPACHEFHFDGIPFTGFHREGGSFEPHRMCGDGDSCMEIYCDREARLYAVIDEATGQPNAYSSRAVGEFLELERSAKERMATLPAETLA